MSFAQADDLKSVRWETIRFALGMVQMAAATVAVVILVRTGVSKWSLLAAVVTCALTTVSVLLFGGRRHGDAHQDATASRKRHKANR